MQRLGRFELLGELGRGSWATVHRARDCMLGREVALKVLHPHLVSESPAVERFLGEARTLAGLHHPHILTIYEVGEVDGRGYIAMELAQGTSLADRLAEQGHLSCHEAINLLAGICRALDHAHRRGIIHGDLKPANIMLDIERGPLITDFGLAHAIHDSPMSRVVQQEAVGSCHYLAPELWDRALPDPRSDLYALGCVAFEILTGQKAFPGETTLAVMAAHLAARDRLSWSAAGLSPVVGSVLEQAVAREKLQRFGSASEFLAALERAVAGETVARAEESCPSPCCAAGPVGHPIHLDWVSVPEGDFIQAPEDPDGQPTLQHVPAFEMTSTPVTNAQYSQFLAATGRSAPEGWEGGQPPPGKSDHPVTGVSWWDARAFCIWAGGRLPTEAEWTRAACGADGFQYPWGNTFSPGCCNSREAGTGDSSPVAAYPRGVSQYGLHDMAGNVWEWCDDWYDEHREARKARKARRARVLRGGCWLSNASEVRTGVRGRAAPHVRLPTVGFRCCRTPPGR